MTSALRALSLPANSSIIRDAVDEGSLVLRQIGGRKLIPVFGFGGLEEWFSNFPRTRRRKTK